MSKRAIRRHHSTRLKRKRSNYITVTGFGDNIDIRIRKAVDTPTPCSCHMCGNPRKYFDEKTIQEKKFDLENLIDFE